MIKNNILRNSLICLLVLLEISGFVVINEVKANAESNGWINVNNSWRYYSGPIINTGWYQSNGNWYYLDDNGIKKTGWIKSEGKWYYLDSCSGKMLIGWIEDKGNWYYLNSSGEMRIGWLEDNGNLYYLNDSGIMVKDAYIASYYLGPNGVWKREQKCSKDCRR